MVYSGFPGEESSSYFSSESVETPGSVEDVWRGGVRMSHRHGVSDFTKGQGRVLELPGNLEPCS